MPSFNTSSVPVSLSKDGSKLRFTLAPKVIKVDGQADVVRQQIVSMNRNVVGLASSDVVTYDDTKAMPVGDIDFYQGSFNVDIKRYQPSMP